MYAPRNPGLIEKVPPCSDSWLEDGERFHPTMGAAKAHETTTSDGQSCKPAARRGTHRPSWGAFFSNMASDAKNMASDAVGQIGQIQVRRRPELQSRDARSIRNYREVGTPELQSRDARSIRNYRIEYCVFLCPALDTGKHNTQY
eukprot:SAG31_NODE_11841_length_993_cov_1.275168_2_plen_144_part_01